MQKPVINSWGSLKDELLKQSFRGNDMKKDNYLEGKKNAQDSKKKLFKHFYIKPVQNITGKIPYAGQDSVQHDK